MSSDEEKVINNVLPEEEIENSENTEAPLKICGKNSNLTKSQLTTIILLSFYFFLTSCYYSLFAPFFPGEANRKGVNQTRVGIIFGIYQLVLLILCPIFGKYLETIGIRFLFVAGLFMSSVSEILFGLLNEGPDGDVFFYMCILCRVVTAIGSSMGLSYAVVGYYFPKKISSIVAMLEVFNGLGLMIGPPLGGFLFEFGGFQLPFFFMGGLLLLVFFFAFFFFPDPQTSKKKLTASPPILPLLKNTRFLLTLLMFVNGSLSIGFIEPSIQLHLAPLNLSPIQLGFILFIPSLTYIIVTPIVGYFCDKYPSSIPWFMFISGLISCISFAFFGPIPWLNLPLKLSIFLSGFIVYGLSIGGLIIPVYAELTKIATMNGYPNDLGTQGIISGIFSSVFSLGSLVGPILGGIVVDLLGFNLASFGIVVIFAISSILYALYYVVKFLKSKIWRDLPIDNMTIQAEREPLLA